MRFASSRRPITPSARPAPTEQPPSAGAGPPGSVVLQAATFRDAQVAEKLQRRLSADLPTNVLIARLDPPGGRPVYSVRVVGLYSLSDVATAESAIRRVGHDPVVIQKSEAAAAEPPKRSSFWSRVLGR